VIFHSHVKLPEGKLMKARDLLVGLATNILGIDQR
jgi:hypothetical protein